MCFSRGGSTGLDFIPTTTVNDSHPALVSSQLVAAAAPGNLVISRTFTVDHSFDAISDNYSVCGILPANDSSNQARCDGLFDEVKSSAAARGTEICPVSATSDSTVRESAMKTEPELALRPNLPTLTITVGGVGSLMSCGSGSFDDVKMDESDENAPNSEAETESLLCDIKLIGSVIHTHHIFCIKFGAWIIIEDRIGCVSKKTRYLSINLPHD